MNQKLDLSGNWSFSLDAVCRGLEEHYETGEFDDVIRLPGTTSEQHKGTPNEARETGHLTDAYQFEGYAWYRKKITLPFRGAGEISGKHFYLSLERTRISHVWVDGAYVGTRDTLVGKHVYDLTGFLKSLSFTITIMIANTGYPVAGGHLTSPDTQSNWNGILGEISLEVCDGLRILNVKNDSDVKKRRAVLDIEMESYEAFEELQVRADIALVRLKPSYAELDAGCYEWDSMALEHTAYPSDHRETDHYLDITEEYVPAVCKTQSAKEGRQTVALDIELPKRAPLWEEEEPYIYRARISAFAGGKGDVKTVWFGLKDFHTDGGEFVINGEKTFLRGRHDGLLFPMSGYAPMNLEGWLRRFKVAKNWGLNHVRFHTCTPPEAAFLAADLLGLYLQPEIEFWGTWNGPEDEGYDAAQEEYLIGEGWQALDSFSSHPSFCMFALGNELWGNAKELNKVLGEYKKKYPKVLFTQGSNNFQFEPKVVENDDYFVGVRLGKERLIRGSYGQCDAPLGHVQTAQPATTHTYDEAIRPSEAEQKEGPDSLSLQIPVVSHEIGQYETYPDFRDINHYYGVLRARNLEVFRERLEAAGLGDLAKDYFACSGALAMACYKDEIETALRSKELAGFQLLDLQDYDGQGTALVGPLNGLLENKGLITPNEWREFCSDAVVQASFDSYVVEAGSTFTFRASLAYYRKMYLEEGILFAQLIDRKDGDHIGGMRSDLPRQLKQGRHYLGTGSFRIPESDKPESYLLEVGVVKHGTVLTISNQYVLWAYPKQKKTESKVRILTDLSEAKRLASAGENVLCYDSPREEESVEGTYCTDFWCYPMFREASERMHAKKPVGTMGLLIRNDHPALALFPSEHYTTPQWYRIVTESRSRILDGSGIRPIVQTIDNFERNHLLGLIYELKEGDGKVLVCTSDLPKLIEEGCASAGQLQHSLIHYLEES